MDFNVMKHMFKNVRWKDFALDAFGWGVLYALYLFFIQKSWEIDFPILILFLLLSLRSSLRTKRDASS